MFRPVYQFWKFSPLGWVLAVIWNFSEWLGKPMPLAHIAFGIIIGAKPKPSGKDLRCR